MRRGAGKGTRCRARTWTVGALRLVGGALVMPAGRGFEDAVGQALEAQRVFAWTRGRVAGRPAARRPGLSRSRQQRRRARPALCGQQPARGEHEPAGPVPP